jgi:hypothetical protein
MIRTIWLAITCLIGIAALTVVKVGTKTFVDETVPPPGVTIGASLEPDALPKGDRLDSFVSDDEAKPIKPIAFIRKQAAPAAIEESNPGTTPEKSWRRSYAKGQLHGHRKSRHPTAAKHRRHHGAAKSHHGSKKIRIKKQNRRRG